MTKTRAKRNVGGGSAKSALERLAEFKRLLRDPDPASLEVLQDMLEELRLARTQQVRNPAPALSDAQFVAEIQQLLLDQDPTTVGVIQDMLLERTMTLSEVSQRMAHPNEGTGRAFQEMEYDDSPGSVMGTFEVTRSSRDVVQTKPVPDARAEGVAWYAAPTSTGNKFFAHVVVHARDHEILIPTGQRYQALDEATRAAIVIAWRAVVCLKNSRDVEGAARVEGLVRHQTATYSRLRIPRQLVQGFDPVGPGDLKQNPPWVTHALADAFESLSSQIPPQWLPKLDQVRGGARGTLVAELKEYGCGAYGCVLPTLDAGVVLKVTTDSTEAEFASQLAADLVAPICVEYFMASSLAARHNKRPIYLLWREAADDVGEIAKVIGPNAEEAIDRQHKAAQDLYVALRGEGPVRILVDERTAAWTQACTEMGRVPELRPLAIGMLRVFREQRVFFGDIHAGNVGRVFRGGPTGIWVITDPGHVAVLGPRP